MGRIKKKVKARNPRNADDLKKYSIEEWNKIPPKYIRNQFKNFIRRCKKIIELKGGRLEPVHLNEIRKEEKEEEEENEEEEEEENEEDENEEEKEKLKLKLIFSKEALKSKINEEIKLIKKKRDLKKEENKKENKIITKIKRYSKNKLNLQQVIENKKEIKEKRDIELENYNFKIWWLRKTKKKRQYDNYFNYYKKECNKIMKEKTKSTTAEDENEKIIDNILDKKIKKSSLEVKKEKLKDEENRFYNLEYIPKK